MTTIADKEYSDAHIRAILGDVKTIAIVGGSPKNIRPSYFVIKYLLSKGYDVIPVNPGQAGRKITFLAICLGEQLVNLNPG